MSESTVILALRILTALSAFVVILSPAPAMLRIHRSKSVGHLTVFPLASLLANSHMWMLYGYFRGNIFPVMVSFGFGDLATIVYLFIYYRHCSEKTTFIRMIGLTTLGLLVISIYAIVAAVGATGQNYEQISHVTGIFAILTAIALYGAPFFEKFVYVMRTKDAQPIQIVMVLCGFVNNSLWVVYTALDDNWLQFIPNAICVPLGITMTVLFVLYSPRGDQTPRVGLPGESIAISIVVSPKTELQSKERTPSVRYDPIVSPLAPLSSRSQDR